MTCLQTNPDVRRYWTRFVPTMAALILLLLFVTWYFHRYHPHGLFAYILAVLPLIPGFGFMVLVVPYLAEGMDEFRRSLTIQAILWASVGSSCSRRFGDRWRRLCTSDTCSTATHSLSSGSATGISYSVSAEEVPMKQRLRATEMQQDFYLRSRPCHSKPSPQAKSRFAAALFR